MSIEKIVFWVKLFLSAEELRDKQRHAEAIYREIESLLRICVFSKVPASDAEDVLSAVMVAIFQNLHKFKKKTDQQFLSWCRIIARNKISDYYRKNGSDRKNLVSLDEILENVDIAGEIVPLSPEQKIDFEYAMSLLRKSNPKCADLLFAFFVIGLDYDEVAKECKIKYDAVRQRIRRCLEWAQGLGGDLV